MTRILKWILSASLLVAFCGPEARAQVINAASCSSTDVQNAFNSIAASTTTVNIPAGSCIWTVHVALNVPSGNTNLSILGAGNLTTTGGGTATTIIDNDAADSNYLLQLNTGVAGSFLRFAGISLQRGSGAIKDNGMLAVNGYSQSVRIDHNTIDAGPYVPIRFTQWMYGVVDHNVFQNSGAIEIWMDNFNNTNGTQNQNFFGDGSWAAPSNWGSGNAIFIENNVFNSNSPSGQSSSYMSDCYSGGRMVIRHNTMNQVGTDVHPTGGAGADIRGCRSTEVYNNTYIGAAGSTSSTYDTFWLSSGTALVWGNTSTNYKNFIELHSMRRDNSTYPQTATPNGWGYCGTSFNGTGSVWDLNSNTTTGYRCLDSPGNGQSDLLTGTAPNKVDSATGTKTWPNQKLEPIYEWLNTFTSVAGGAASKIVNGNDTSMSANTDFFLYTSTFTGASGTGSGLLAARPSTCTPLVLYWATDTNTAYQCATTNTWATFYTPYTYPHPLTAGTQSSGNPPAAPTDVTAQVD